MAATSQPNPSPRAQKVREHLQKLEAAPTPESSEAEASSLAVSCGSLFERNYIEGERIAFELQRGEVGLIVARPNAGKTTLALNAALALCIGNAFSVLVEAGPSRKVLFVDGETRASRLKSDLQWLIKDFSSAQQQAVKQQLHLICDCEIDGQPLSLTIPEHFLALQAEVQHIKPDLIIFDTMASLFHVFNENDNAEQNRRVWRPLQKLARQAEATCLVSHHIGKRQSEEGGTPDKMYLGRGASSSAASARAVWTLDVDKATNITTLTLAKAKGKPEFETKLQLDSSRWFQELKLVTGKSSYDVLRERVTVEMTKKEIVLLMADTAKERQVESLLAQAISNKHLTKGKRGAYRPFTLETALPLESANE